MIWEKINRFSSISNYKSLSEAARSEKISQSTLSRDIATLENAFGAILIARSYNGIKLTDDGSSLIEIVQSFRGNLKNFKTKIQFLKSK